MFADASTVRCRNKRTAIYSQIHFESIEVFLCNIFGQSSTEGKNDMTREETYAFRRYGHEYPTQPANSIPGAGHDTWSSLADDMACTALCPVPIHGNTQLKINIHKFRTGHVQF
jgi:hypothetical protein